MDIGETNILEAEQFAKQEFDKYYIKNGIQLSNKISYAAYINNITIGVSENKSDSRIDKLYYTKELGGYCADVFTDI